MQKSSPHCCCTCAQVSSLYLQFFLHFIFTFMENLFQKHPVLTYETNSCETFDCSIKMYFAAIHWMPYVTPFAQEDVKFLIHFIERSYPNFPFLNVSFSGKVRMFWYCKGRDQNCNSASDTTVHCSEGWSSKSRMKTRLCMNQTDKILKQRDPFC